MIHNLEDKTTRELREIIKTQMKEYQALQKRLAEVEQWVAAIADDHEQIPDWIQQSARSLLASGPGMSNECLKMSNALKIANKRIDELERYNLGLANESHNKTMAIERFKKRLAEVERELTQKKLVHVGYTNGYQIYYAKNDESGSFYPDTYNDCYIPLYMLDIHLHRLETTLGEELAGQLRQQLNGDNHG